MQRLCWRLQLTSSSTRKRTCMFSKMLLAKMQVMLRHLQVMLQVVYLRFLLTRRLPIQVYAAVHEAWSTKTWRKISRYFLFIAVVVQTLGTASCWGSSVELPVKHENGPDLGQPAKQNSSPTGLWAENWLCLRCRPRSQSDWVNRAALSPATWRSSSCSISSSNFSGVRPVKNKAPPETKHPCKEATVRSFPGVVPLRSGFEKGYIYIYNYSKSNKRSWGQHCLWERKRIFGAMRWP